uniref:Reverse transcriptase zinc-binding domain-containing protein n=1 Tax=Cannabis sativa TaxID=3483 RepID=A0A803NFE9_CANSA
MSIFTLPNKVIAAIDRRCREFLWGTTGNRSKLHFPSWEKVCLLKKYGGVGFREGKKWNKALMAKFLWAIARKQDSLWVKWINSIYLKGQNVWSYPIKQDVSWYFKKLMKIRSSTDEISILLAEKGGKFCAKLFYNLQVEAQEVKYSRAVWNKLIVPKHIFIFWQACNVQLLTRDHLSKFLSLPSTLCPVCENDIETYTHTFYLIVCLPGKR